MLNLEHAKILARGVDIWNLWRDKNSNIIPDLSNVDLSNMNLNTANFSNTNLSNSDLRWTHLAGADFTKANLTLATLTWANLTGSNFIGANLKLSNLIRANLTHANFSFADFNEALFRETIFGSTFLRNSKNLDSCLYFGPNTIDLRTIKVSWPLPPEFLRGCGLPDDFIEYLPQLIRRAYEFHSSFICYSTKDQRFANILYDDLKKNGVSCWIFTEDQKIGTKKRDIIMEEICHRDKLLIILSNDSIDSPEVEMEVEKALEEEKKRGQTVLFPIRIDNAVENSKKGWTIPIRTLHIGDFREWKDPNKYQKALRKLLSSLKIEKEK